MGPVPRRPMADASGCRPGHDPAQVTTGSRHRCQTAARRTRRPPGCARITTEAVCFRYRSDRGYGVLQCPRISSEACVSALGRGLTLVAPAATIRPGAASGHRPQCQACPHEGGRA